MFDSYTRMPIDASYKFSTTDLKRSASKVYNRVLQDGCVLITHRDRATMILITIEEFESAVDKARRSE